MERVYGRRYPVDEDFLSCLEHMPPASGIALGADRVIMLATGAGSVEKVIWTPLLTSARCRLWATAPRSDRAPQRRATSVRSMRRLRANRPAATAGCPRRSAPGSSL